MPEGNHSPGDPIDWSAVRLTARRRFGISRFRPGQRELIEAVLAGRNAIGILPTGAGKSLCYQLPSLFLEGLVVVVAPLIALMTDQHDRLESASIEAARLDSTVKPRERDAAEDQMRAGAHDIVLVTPERLVNPDHLAPLRARGVALVVVDEAHCVSQWGHDFRPAYLQLRAAIEALGSPPVLALTATAPPDVVRDIELQLGIAGADLVQTGIERDNLHFEVLRTVNQADKEARLMELLGATPGHAIVYAATTRRVDELHDWLAAAGVSVAKYHGKLRTAEREEAQRAFMSGERRVIVATNAFGLGIDKPDVRLVAHWNFPESVESYYQEAGRGGRDGEPARAVLLYRLEDKRIRSFLLGGRHPRRHEALAVLTALGELGGARRGASVAALATRSGLGERRVTVIAAALESMAVVERRGRGYAVRRPLSPDELERFLDGFEERTATDRERLQTIMRYAQQVGCRMQFMREYFGEALGERCGHCDSCAAPTVAVAVAAPGSSAGPDREAVALDLETPSEAPAIPARTGTAVTF
jgi:ATP-dependent DNA helicase RecQ